MDMEMVYQIRKSRGINWTHEEKEYLVQLCCQRARIIEDKRSDVHTLRKKAVAWKVVYDKFSARFGRKRPPVRVKEQWKRMKIAARAELREKQRTSTAEDSTGAGIVVLGGTESDINRSKYCSESEELLSQVQAILNSEFPGGTEEADDTGVEMVADDVGDVDPIVIKVESDMEDLENSSQGFYETESSTNGYEEIQSRPNSTPVPVNIVHTTNQNQRRYQDPQSRTSESWDMYNTKLASQGPEFRKSSFSDHNSHRNNIVKKLERSGSYGHQTDNSEMIAQYSRREHLRKMEIMEKEHQAKMEILKIEREVAVKKLRKAEFKLNMYNSMHNY